jgi:hypothetical protein
MCLVYSVLNNIGQCVKYFGVLSANYLRPFPDFSHREYLAKVARINNTYWSAFSINRVKMLNINIKIRGGFKNFINCQLLPS